MTDDAMEAFKRERPETERLLHLTGPAADNPIAREAWSEWRAYRDGWRAAKDDKRKVN